MWIQDLIVPAKIQKAADIVKTQQSTQTTNQTKQTTQTKQMPKIMESVLPKTAQEKISTASNLVQKVPDLLWTQKVQESQIQAPNMFENIVGKLWDFVDKANNVIDKVTDSPYLAMSHPILYNQIQSYKSITKNINDMSQTWREIYDTAKETWTKINFWEDVASPLLYSQTQYGIDLLKWYANMWLDYYNNWSADIMWSFGELSQEQVDAIKSNWQLVNSAKDSVMRFFERSQAWLESTLWQTSWVQRLKKLQENWIWIQDAIKNKDVKSIVNLIAGQMWSSIPAMAWTVAWSAVAWPAWWLIWWWTMSIPVYYEESLDRFKDVEWVSDNAKKNWALWTAALKSTIESLDTWFQLFWWGKGRIPVKRSAIRKFIEHKAASSLSEAWEEVAQYWVDEIAALIMWDDIDWKKVYEDAKEIWIEAAIYAVFFPTWTQTAYQQSQVNKAYKDIEKQVREDMPEATDEQVKKVTQAIMEHHYEQADIDKLEDKQLSMIDKIKELREQLKWETNQSRINIKNKRIDKLF